jgi:hypothetical protein
MATDTPNFNWPIPEDSDLIKDGAKAIRDLGNAIDTSAQDFGGGLVHINTTTFSGVAAQAVPNGTFTSEFRNYKIIISNFTSTNDGVDTRLRLRISGTDTTTTTYFRRALQASSSSLVNSAESSTGFYIGNTSSTTTVPSIISIELFNPQVATRTQIAFQMFSGQNDSYFAGSGFQQDTASQFDAFNIFGSSGNIAGQIQVFGYRQ